MSVDGRTRSCADVMCNSFLSHAVIKSDPCISFKDDHPILSAGSEKLL